MNRFKNNTTVIMAKEVKGVVTACCIRGVEPSLRLVYEVSWFVGWVHHEAWFEEYQLEEFKEVKKQPGLVNYQTDLEINK